MSNYPLWEQLKALQSPNYKWIDLTHTFGEDTPRWPGFDPLGNKTLFDFSNAPMKVNHFSFPGQYGTHVDAPGHFVQNGRLVDEINVSEFAYPLCVIDVHKKVEENHDYALTVQDIKDFEENYGQIPEGAFVAMRSDWSKRWPDQDASLNKDENGISRYPGWSLEALQFLFEVRNVGAIGHEPFDTDPPLLQVDIGFAGEDYVLQKDKFQIEVMNNLDQVPPVGAIIFCTFPKAKNATGFPARCFAICPID
ncbi:cyclase family protein [Bacillus massiliigorillae]|uniref:cyclase family protein n=1 Tax=Bacillus massiliigorillae TaxID=1243664 RepID=UPI0003A7C8B4|nr:cyclase family protein [Bacillus massiliigorillae]